VWFLKFIACPVRHKEISELCGVISINRLTSFGISIYLISYQPIRLYGEKEFGQHSGRVLNQMIEFHQNPGMATSVRSLTTMTIIGHEEPVFGSIMTLVTCAAITFRFHIK